MENILRKPYEISVWEDFTPTDDKQFYQERKLLTIGSDTMTSKAKACNPTFKENVNGTHTLTFTLYSKYFDEEEAEFVDNPFLPYMVNERKIKLNYDGEWYDFIIKNIEEDSVNHSFNYTLIDSFINELSKNGFSIELDTELENNTGTIKELSEAILEETDWKVGEVDTLVETNIEALYAVKIPLGTTIKAIDMKNLDGEPITISSKEDLTGTEVESIIYVFYSSAFDETIPMQFLYREDGEYTVDEDGVINNSPNYLLVEGNINVNVENGATNEFRGKRIVQKEITKYDATTDKFVTVYEDKDKKEIYMYTENEYISPVILTNYAANSKNFTDTSGWLGASPLEIKNVIYPSMYDVKDYYNTVFVPYMRVKYNAAKPVYNAGIISNISFMSKGIAAGEQFVFRVKYGTSNGEKIKPTKDILNNLRAKVAQYDLDINGNYNFDGSQEIISFINSTPFYETEIDEDSNLSYVYYIASATKSISYSELKSNKKPIGLFFTLKTPDTNNYYFIQDIQFFPYKIDGNNNIVLPGTTPNSCVKKKYLYYYPNQNTDNDNIKYEYTGNEKSSDYTIKYDKTFEKIRTIKAKESNRFNLIQNLCEIFECWPSFIIEHNDDGSIKIDKDGPIKKINFKEYTGEDNYTGFKYGINLKSIKRTLDSDQIVSKIIVKPNSNEYGIDGYCDIARATENPIKENFLLNFRYYIQQGLLDENEVNNDLYLYIENGKYLGYYVQLNKINKEYDSDTLKKSLISTAITNIDSAYSVYKTAYDEAINNVNEAKNVISNFCGVSYETLVSNESLYNRYISNTEIQNYITKVQTWTAQANQFKAYYTQKENELEQQKTELEKIIKKQKELIKQKEELNYKFYQKYSKYIQEGSWISEDYMDDNLYYLDAENVLNTSAFPEVNYTIDVIELSQLEDYSNYNFRIGDKTYIEDTEFFGYTYIDGIKTPYKEEVILSEITYNLDSPETNQIKIQNYKTQFEDLFQRVTAATQSLQFQTGNFQRAAGAFNTNGSLSQDALQNSLINNSLILSNATSQSVVWDNTGITITNSPKPNEVVRLVSKGILISNDGGDTWVAGITGNGINASYLTAGQIDASRINIFSGEHPTFRWDTNGISAYRYILEEGTNKPTDTSLGNFVRFDQYGLYGINTGKDLDFIAKDLDEVKKFAQFGLTWDGFFLKSNHTKGDYSVNGRIEISSDEDIQVIDGNNVERIKIGLLDVTKNKDNTYTGHYGIRISDLNGKSVMMSNDDGMLWLTQKILIGPNFDFSAYYTSRVELGIINSWLSTDKTGPLYNKAKIPYSKILSIKDGTSSNTENLAIYDTGRIIARDAEIHGSIYADSGTIGGISVTGLADAIGNINLSKLSIVSEKGNIIRYSSKGEIAPQEMTFRPKLQGIDYTNNILVNWQTSPDGDESNYTDLPGSPTEMEIDYDDNGEKILVGGELTISSNEFYNKFNQDGVLFLKAVVNLDGGRRYEDIIILTLIKETDLSGLDIDTYSIELNYPEILKFYNTNNILTFSPQELLIKSYKGNSDTGILDNSKIEYEFYLYSQYKNYYNTDEDKWFKLNGQIREVVYNETTGLYTDTGNLIDSPFNNYIGFIDNITYKILFEDFYKTIQTATTNYFDITLRDILGNENTAFKIKLIDKETKKVIAITTTTIVFGTSDDMASFALTASNIQMAVRDAGLIFDSKGLHVVNGGFEIINEIITEDESGNTIISKENLFYINENELYMKGNGEFTGTINATDGQFNGSINALDGTLGNLSISGLLNINDNLYINGLSTESNPYVGIYSSNYNEDNGFYISPDGNIIANQLSLGAGASIKKYIKLGNNSWIINPEWLNNEFTKENPDSIIIDNNLNRDSFITIKDNINQDLLNIKQNGIISIGKDSGIKIDGNTQTINSFNYNSNNLGWSISPEKAEFNNITARGSLKTVTFEYEQNTVQSIGGILLIKPSSSIKEVSLLSDTELDITTETEVIINESDFIKIGDSSLEDKLFTGRNSNQQNHIILNINSNSITDINNLIGKPLINMGGRNTASIVVNGSESNSIYPKTSISIFENGVTSENGEHSLNPEIKLVLGQMPSFIKDKTYDIFNANSYGLYAENVFLKGALISEGKDKNNNLFYTGINTQSNVEFSEEDKALFKDSNNIVLWAGAPNTNGKIDIQKAKFKVDNLGNLYANSGYFVGTIITDATITASKIKTAVIEGNQYKNENGIIIDKEAALTIKNADVGIKFDGNNQTIMELNTNGLNLKSSLNIGNDFHVRADSSLIVPITLFSKTRKDENITVITPNKIGFTNIKDLPSTEDEYDSLVYNSYLTNNADGLSIFEKNISVISFKSDEVKSKQSIRMGGQMLSFYDEKGDRIKMQTVVDNTGIIGYDLYLS